MSIQCCEFCGVEYAAKVSWAKFCSPLCKERNRARRDPDRQKRAYDPVAEHSRQQKRYYGDLERNRERVRQWHRDNPERSRHNSRSHKYRVKGAPGSHTVDEWESLLSEFNYGCAYCPNAGTTKDHLIPISKGGTNDIGNIVPACRSCNSSKSNKTLMWDWTVNGSVGLLHE